MRTWRRSRPETDRFAAERAADTEYLAREETAELAGASEDELIGLIYAADRAEAAASYVKHAAAAELIRRRPAPGRMVTAGMPEAYLDSAGDEVKWALAETRAAADGPRSLAHDLEVKLRRTRAAFRDGRLRQAKVVIIARATAVLDPDEARLAEARLAVAIVLDRAPLLSPGALRGAIRRAVATVAPGEGEEPARARARGARVERWAEDSGNAGRNHPTVR